MCHHCTIIRHCSMDCSTKSVVRNVVWIVVGRERKVNRPRPAQLALWVESHCRAAASHWKSLKNHWKSFGWRLSRGDYWQKGMAQVSQRLARLLGNIFDIILNIFMIVSSSSSPVALRTSLRLLATTFRTSSMLTAFHRYVCWTRLWCSLIRFIGLEVQPALLPGR